MSTSPPQPPTGGQQQPPPSGEQQQGPPGGQGGIPGMPQITLPNGQRPTPEQIQEIQKRLAADAEKMGMTVPQFVEHIKKQAAENQARMRAAQAAGQPMPQGPGGPGGPPGAGQTGRSQPIAPGPPKPEALALAKFLRSQELKPRTCILNGERKDMFRGELNRWGTLLNCTDSLQSSVHSAPSNRLLTRRPARRTLSCRQ